MLFRSGKFIDDYLINRETLRGIVQIVDLRHPPSKDDIAMYEWMCHLNQDILIVATKCDKISKGQWQKHVKQIRDGLKAGGNQEIILFSAETGHNLEKIQAWVEAHVDVGAPIEE